MIGSGFECELVSNARYALFETIFGTTFKCLSEGKITLSFLLNVLILELLFLLSYYITHNIESNKINKFIMGLYGIFLITMIGVAFYPFVDVIFFQ